MPKFRTNYDNCGYDGKEYISGESLTRPDTYEPLAQLVDRLTRVGNMPMYFVDDDSDGSSFDEFDIDEYEDKVEVLALGMEAEERLKQASGVPQKQSEPVNQAQSKSQESAKKDNSSSDE